MFANEELHACRSSCIWDMRALGLYSGIKTGEYFRFPRTFAQALMHYAGIFLFSPYRNKNSLTSAKPTAGPQRRRLSRVTYSLFPLYLYLSKQKKVKREIQETGMWDDVYLRLWAKLELPTLQKLSSLTSALTQVDQRASVYSILYGINNNWALQCSLYNKLLKIRFGALTHHLVGVPCKVKTHSAVNSDTSFITIKWETVERCSVTQA